MWNSLMSLGRKSYSGAKKLIGSALDGASNVISKVGDISDWIDNMLNVAQSYPIVGDIAHNLTDSEIYKDVREIIHGAGQFVGDATVVYNDLVNQLEAVPPPALFDIGV